MADLKDDCEEVEVSELVLEVEGDFGFGMS